MAANGRERADDALILALAAGHETNDAAKTAGVSPRTVFRRLGDTEFRERVATARAKMFQRAVGRLADAATDAADAMRKLLRAESESVRLGAARGILEMAGKLQEIDALARRLDELERIVERQQKPNAERYA